MSFVNYLKKEIHCKIVYFGPGMGGKTTNVQYIYEKTSPHLKSKMVSLNTQNERTLFFDFLPLELGVIQGMKVRMHLYTVPGQSFYEASRKLILRGADGIIFVGDSQVERLEANIESFDSLNSSLEELGVKLSQLPHLFQWNKRDLPNTTPISLLESSFNHHKAPSFEGCATKGIGVFDSLKQISKMVLLNIRGPLERRARPLKAHRSSSRRNDSWPRIFSLGIIHTTDFYFHKATNMHNPFKGHRPIMVQEIIALALSHPKAIENRPMLVMDLTFGGGGHSKALLENLPEGSVLMAFDQDPDVKKHTEVEYAEEIKEGKIYFTPANFSSFSASLEESPLKELVASFGGGVDLSLMDLGISSHQLDTAERGISFRREGLLDMRMNYESQGPTAADLVNDLPEKELADLLFEYGEETLSRRIAANICAKRKEKRLETTSDLEEIVFTSYPAKFRHGRTHPATKTFQALRIAVNGELEVLTQVLDPLLLAMAPKGLLMAISFHSLEDRIVKHKFKFWKINSQGTILTKRPLTSGKEELQENPRARSAKLRVFQK